MRTKTPVYGTVTNEPSFLERLFDGVGSEHLGLTLDTGNFYWFGHPLDDVYRLYEKFAPRAFHTHIKSIAYPEERRNVRRPMGWEYGKYASPIHQGDIDFRRVIGILEGGDEVSLYERSNAASILGYYVPPSGKVTAALEKAYAEADENLKNRLKRAVEQYRKRLTQD